MASEATIVRCLDLLTKAPPSQLESLRAGGADHARSLRRIVDSNNVVAVGISEKISKKKPTGKLAVTFYVEKKIPMKKLRADRMIPPTVPETLSGPEAVPTDVVAIGPFAARGQRDPHARAAGQQHRTRRHLGRHPGRARHQGRRRPHPQQ